MDILLKNNLNKILGIHQVPLLNVLHNRIEWIEYSEVLFETVWITEKGVREDAPDT